MGSTSWFLIHKLTIYVLLFGFSSLSIRCHKRRLFLQLIWQIRLENFQLQLSLFTLYNIMLVVNFYKDWYILWFNLILYLLAFVSSYTLVWPCKKLLPSFKLWRMKSIINEFVFLTWLIHIFFMRKKAPRSKKFNSVYYYLFLKHP